MKTKVIHIPDEMITDSSCAVELHNMHSLTTTAFEVPDSLDETIFNRYLGMVRDKDQHLDEFDVKYLIKALIQAEKNKYDINSLLLVALLAGERKVIYEHHLKKQQPA